MELSGKYNTAKVFSNNVEETARNQIIELCNQPAFEGSKIRIMPDVHAGKGCVIGFTADLGNKIIPNLIGVDIGCGVKVVDLGKIDINFNKLDKFINKEIPSGTNVRKQAVHIDKGFKEKIAEVSARIKKPEKLDYFYESIGTLGAGNHFIEIDKDDKGCYYLLVHSGSRHFGHTVASFFQKEAIEYCKARSKQLNPIAEIKRLKAEGKTQFIQEHIEDITKKNIYAVPHYLAFLEGNLAEDYLYCMKIAQQYAVLNRNTMAHEICNEFDIDIKESFTTIHNYIDDKGMIRKGAVSAQKGEKLVIPINMRDGSIIAMGKGNPDWNYSAPHGAGRLMSRSKAAETLNLQEFKNSMQGIFTTSVDRKTLDEAPMAYKPIEEILSFICETVDIIAQIKPAYNFKGKE